MASSSRSSSGSGGVLPHLLVTPGEDGSTTVPVDFVTTEQLVKEMEDEKGRGESGCVLQEWLLYVKREWDDTQFRNAICAMEWWTWKENWRLSCISAYNLKNKGEWLPESHSFPKRGFTQVDDKEEPPWFRTPHSVFHEL